MVALRQADEPRRYYDYRAANGQLSYQVIRVPLPDGGKKFVQRRPDNRDGWIYSLGDITPLPYLLPELLQAVAAGWTVFIVEGEKCATILNAALAAADAQAIATCNNGGAGKWSTTQSVYLAGATVVMLPDNDKAGRDHVVTAGRALRAAGVTSLKMISLPGLADKGDIADWLGLGQGNTIPNLLERVRGAGEYTPPEADRPTTNHLPDRIAQPTPNLAALDRRERVRLMGWARVTLDRATADLAGLTDGRFAGLKRVANRLGTIAAHGLLTDSECLNALYGAVASNGYAQKKGQVTAEKIARFYFDKGKPYPCELPNLTDDKPASQLTAISRNQEIDTDTALAIGLYREYVASIGNRLTFGAFSLIRNTYPKGAALVAFLAARIGQFKSGGQVNRLLLQAEAVALGWKISRQTIDNGLAALCKGGMCKKLDPVLAEHSNTGSKILPTYQLDLNTGFTEAKERAIYRTWETANPAHPDAPLGKLRPELISDPVAHNGIDQALRTTYASDQSGKGERRAKWLLQSMKARLDDQRVFELDFEAPISNEADLVIAYAHALAKADAATQADGKAHISLERWADWLGVSRATAGKIQAALGIVEADITPVILTSVAQVAAAGREHKGRITGIVRIDAHENRDVIRLGDPKYAARAVKVALDAGYRVEAQIQRANKILPFERPVIAHKERTVKPADPDLVSNAKSTPREIAPEVEKPYRFRAYSPRRYRGSGHNPDYKLAYAAQILSRLDYHAGVNQRALDSRGQLVYRASGKIILSQPTTADLYALAPHDTTYTDENEDQLMYTEKELVEPIQRQLSRRTAKPVITTVQPDTDLAYIDAQFWYAASDGSADRDRIVDRVIDRGGAYRERFNEYVRYFRLGGAA